MTFEELEIYFKDHIYSSYEREKYDEFLKSEHFSFVNKSIHITGTNGKGSTANFLYHIYKENGLHVGMYTSPYLSDVTEMIQIDGENISKDEYLSLFLNYQKKFEKYHLSSFEMQTFLAFTYFKQKNLDLVIVEVGMGGFIDATNVITPLLSIITNVSLEHTAYLGRSVSEIALNKAGIIKENTPVLVGKLDDSALYAVKEYAKDMNANLFTLNDYHNERVVDKQLHFDYYPYKDLVINTLAMYQIKNASLAIEAVKILNSQIPVSEENIKKGLMSNFLIGRYEYLSNNLLIDGAHNPDAIDNLVESLKDSEHRNIHVVFASFKDKNIEKMLISLGQISNDITLTTFDHIRARNEEDYFLYLGDYKFEPNYLKLVNDLLANYPDDLVLVTGSLAFVGLFKKQFIK